jgi:antitoxin component YwqK of YwqJK toxin-antitoxin module
MDIAYVLYKEYIDNTDYVYYKDKNTIIIMKKQGDLECICDVPPKKYHSANLKVVLMFDLTDPYKLVSDLEEYKIDKLTYSYCYLSLEEAVNLHQAYYYNGQIEQEYSCINGKLNGIYQHWYENGIRSKEITYINGLRNGLYMQWFQSGDKCLESNYINGKKEG